MAYTSQEIFVTAWDAQNKPNKCANVFRIDDMGTWKSNKGPISFNYILVTQGTVLDAVKLTVEAAL